MRTKVYDIWKSRLEIHRLINNFEVLNIAEQFKFIWFSFFSTRCTFIYDIYDNVNFLIIN